MLSNGVTTVVTAVPMDIKDAEGYQRCCAQVGIEVTGCWYDLRLVKTVLIVQSNIWEISLPIYIIPIIGAQRQLLPLTAVCRCRPYFIVGHLSLSAVSGVANVRYHNTGNSLYP